MPSNLNLSSAALGFSRGDGTIEILLVVSYAETNVSESITAFAEVWGTAKNGSVVPVAWIGGATDVTRASRLCFSRAHSPDALWLRLLQSTRASTSCRSC